MYLTTAKPFGMLSNLPKVNCTAEMKNRVQVRNKDQRARKKSDHRTIQHKVTKS
jgi:hypothetical protein